MKKILRNLIISFTAVYVLAYVINIAAAANISLWGSTFAPSNVPTDIRQAIMNVTNWVLGFVAMICVLVVIYGLVTGVNTIKYGLIGLAIMGLAYAIVIVVLTVILQV